MIGTGTILNVVGILAGGIAGLARRKSLLPATESFLKIVIFAFVAYYGLRLTWLSLNGGLWQILKQLLIAILSLTLGRLTGKVLRLQRLSNHLGRVARQHLTSAQAQKPGPSDGFKVCAALFCAEPLASLGAIQDGLSSYFYPLAIKAVIDGLATLGFAPMFGWRVLLAALPVAAFQGTLTLLCAGFVKSLLEAHGLVNSVNAVGGLLVFSVSLTILEVRQIALADYLPSVVIAPLLAWALK